ncbi:MAG TPA: zf-TFIIB domain-containing protein, partial [Sphingomicrobium sp.]|nr:zf-TFIIB domain-containing protein [Sphingomicrobium sp.]
ERSGIEIDYCPTCRGIWLDRGELDKIIECNAQAASAPLSQQGVGPGQPQQRQDEGYRSKLHKRRKSFLEELFD